MVVATIMVVAVVKGAMIKGHEINSEDDEVGMKLN